MKTAFMFPGQGSQKVGMSDEFLAAYPVVKETYQEASDAIGVDLLALAESGPEERLNETEITQPIVMTASVAIWRVWNQLSDALPDVLCGHSLGEYTALVAAEAMAFSDAVRLVHKRGQLMQGAVPLGEGAMAAILGLDDASIEAVCAAASGDEVVEPANYNSPGQVVISGSVVGLESVIPAAKDAGAKRAALLPVSVPCHCSLLKPAGEALAEEISNIQISEPNIPIIQNVTAAIPASLEDLKSHLLSHLYSPVKWSDSILALSEQGVERFVECGPGKVLSTLNRRIVKGVETHNVSLPEGLVELSNVMQGAS